MATSSAQEQLGEGFHQQKVDYSGIEPGELQPGVLEAGELELEQYPGVEVVQDVKGDGDGQENAEGEDTELKDLDLSLAPNLLSRYIHFCPKCREKHSHQGLLC